MPQGTEVRRVDRWMSRIDRLPRLGRVILSLVITLELVIILWLIVAALFGMEPLDPDPDTTAPLLVIIVLGLTLYAVGWWALVGFDMDPNQPWRAEPPALVYVLLGAAGFVLLVMLAIYGLAFGYTL